MFTPLRDWLTFALKAVGLKDERREEERKETRKGTRKRGREGGRKLPIQVNSIGKFIFNLL